MEHIFFNNYIELLIKITKNMLFLDSYLNNIIFLNK